MACGWIALGVAVVIPIVVWLIWGLDEAANMAQVVSIPLAVVSMVIGIIPLPHRNGSGVPANPVMRGGTPPSGYRSRRWEVIVTALVVAAGLAIGTSLLVPGVTLPSTNRNQSSFWKGWSRGWNGLASVPVNK